MAIDRRRHQQRHQKPIRCEKAVMIILNGADTDAAGDIEDVG